MNVGKQKYRYPGTRPFTMAEREFFFGRDKDIQELIQLIKLDKQVVLYGKSGLGKSSIINAGVIPELIEEEDYEAIHIRFGSYSEYQDITPTDILRQSIQEKMTYENFLWKNVLELDPNDPEKIKSQQDIALLENLWCYLKSLQIENPKKKSFLLIFDQFEELFTYQKKDIDNLSSQLEQMLHVKLPATVRSILKSKLKKDKNFISGDRQRILIKEVDLRIVFSIRSDKLSLLNKLKKHLPDILQNTYELTPLSIEQAKDAIIKPAALDKSKYNFHSPSFSYSQSALDLMINFLSKRRQQKIETFQLQILCEHAESVIDKKNESSDTLTIAKEDLGNVDHIFENYYDNQIAKIKNPEDQKLAKVFIEEGLIFEEDNRRLSVYEGQAIKMYYINKELLDKLVSTRIIRTEPHPSGGFSYELSHDTLVVPILKAKARRIKDEKSLKEERERKIIEQKRRKKIIRYAAIILAIVSVIIAFLAVNIISVNRERDKIALQRDSLNQKNDELNRKNEEIEQLYKTLRDRTLKSVQLKFDKLVTEGNSLKSQGNYEAAIEKYNEALKSIEGYALDTRELVKNINDSKKLIESSGEFSRLIHEGNNLLAKNDESLYNQAMQKYKQAAATGTNTSLARSKIASLNSKINSRFEYYKKKGLEAMSLNNAPGKARAKQLFNKALVLKPGDEFIKQKIVECEK